MEPQVAVHVLFLSKWSAYMSINQVRTFALIMDYHAVIVIRVYFEESQPDSYMLT